MWVILAGLKTTVWLAPKKFPRCFQWKNARFVSLQGAIRMTLYDNRLTHFFSATMRFHGHPKEVFRSAPHIRKMTILTWMELGPYS